MTYTSRDWEDYDHMADELAGNWRKFESFAWHRRYDIDNPEDWCIINTNHRDSDILDRSNAEMIEKKFAHFFACDSPYIMYEHANHWAVGWIDGYAIKVHDKRGKVTKAFKRMCDIQASLADYPILDEMHYSELEYNETIEWLESEYSRFVDIDIAPDGWEYELYSYLSDCGWEATEGYMSSYRLNWRQSEQFVKSWLQEMGWLDLYHSESDLYIWLMSLADKFQDVIKWE